MRQPLLKIVIYFLANLGYNISKKELHDVGIVTMNTTFGNSVPVYDAGTEVTEQQIGIYRDRNQKISKKQAFSGMIRIVSRM